MEKWEYLHIRFYEDKIDEPTLKTQLNLYGANGWELVSCMECNQNNPFTKNPENVYSCIFKRKIQQG